MEYNWEQIKVLQDAFGVLFNNEFLSDIKFSFPDGQVLYAHSLILSLRSKEFYDSFKSTIGVTKLIQVNDFSYDIYHEFLKYMYTDGLDINAENVDEMLKLSKKYALKMLESRCAENLSAKFSIQTICKTLDESVANEYFVVQEKILEYISDNFIEVLESPAFLEVSNNTLVPFLKLEEVNFNDEFKIFELIMKWAEKACQLDDSKVCGKAIREKLGDSLMHIRFPSMEKEEIEKCESLYPNLLNDSDLFKIYKSKMFDKNHGLSFVNKKRNLKGTKNLAEMYPDIDVLENTRSKNKLGNYYYSNFYTAHIGISNINVSTRNCMLIEIVMSATCKGGVRFKVDKVSSPNPDQTVYNRVHDSVERENIEEGVSFVLDPPVLIKTNTNYKITYEFVVKKPLALASPDYISYIVAKEKIKCTRFLQFTELELAPLIASLKFRN